MLRFRSRVLRFRVLGASFSRFRVLRFRSRVLRFRDLGASFSSFGCFVLRSSFSSASFSKLPYHGRIAETFPIYFPDRQLCYLNSQVSFLTDEHN